MSKIIVPVVTIEKVDVHPNAENLEIVQVGGWQVVCGKGNVKPGDQVVHFPPQAVLPLELSDRLGVTQYLSKGRVKVVRLRGEVSHGFVAPLAEVLQNVDLGLVDNGMDLSGDLGITKYEPPVKALSGDAAPETDLFPKYTSIENMRNFKHVFSVGDEVVVTEKIHGTNSRIGMVEGVMFAGSKGVNRKPPQSPDGKPLEGGFEIYAHHTYWFPWSLASVQALFADLAEKRHQSVILYGEIYGASVQKLDYGVKKGTFGYMAFDLMVDGKFLDHGEFMELCQKHGVPTVPVIATVPFDYDVVKNMADGGTMVDGANHIREGVVVRSVKETSDVEVGRKILKFVSSEYLAKDFETDQVDDQ